MEHSRLQRQVACMKKSLVDQVVASRTDAWQHRTQKSELLMVLDKGYLDEQFYQLEELQDEASPNFVEEVVTLFFSDSSRLVANIEQALWREESPRFHRLDSFMHQLMDSTLSIGALRVKNECARFREHCEEENLQRCQGSLQKVKREHAILKQKLEAYFQLLRQIGPADGATRPGN